MFTENARELSKELAYYLMKSFQIKFHNIEIGLTTCVTDLIKVIIYVIAKIIINVYTKKYSLIQFQSTLREKI